MAFEGGSVCELKTGGARWCNFSSADSWRFAVLSGELADTYPGERAVLMEEHVPSSDAGAPSDG